MIIEEDPDELYINEIFYSLEGEGQRIGYPTIFIRLAGCNLECNWCDTNHQEYKEMGTSEIIEQIEGYNCDNIKITGGEPLLQSNKLGFLLRILKDKGYYISLETNGTIYDYTIFNKCDLICMDIKTPSSGMKSDFNVISRVYERYKDKIEFKLVISGDEDLLFAESYCLLNNIILMPDTKNDYMNDLIDKMKDKFPNCRFGLRLHEVLGIK
jgi:7-carboxy-7-deazaguanine synthase